MNVLDKLTQCHCAIVYLEFIVENYDVLRPFVLRSNPSIKTMKQRGMCHFVHVCESEPEEKEKKFLQPRNKTHFYYDQGTGRSI